MLVRMTKGGEPKYIDNVGVTSIRPTSDGVLVGYGPDIHETVDGTPDEVFKALMRRPNGPVALLEELKRTINSMEQPLEERSLAWEGVFALADGERAMRAEFAAAMTGRRDGDR